MYSVLCKKENAHEDSIWTCTWSRPPEDTQDYIVTGSLDTTAKVWQWLGSDLRQVHTLRSQQLAVISLDSKIDGSVDAWTVALSPDSSLFATGSQSGKLSIYNVANPVERESSLETGGKFILDVAFSPDGRLLAGSSVEGMIYVFDLESASLLYTMEGHAMAIRSILFTPDSKSLITASDDKYIKIHDLSASSSLVGTLAGHSSWVLSVAAAPDGRAVASGSADNTVKVWDFATRQILHTFKEHVEQVWSVQFGPSGDRLVSTSDDKSIVIYSVAV